MKILFLTALLLSLSSGPLLADKETDERLAKRGQGVRRNHGGAGQGIPRE